MPDSGFLAVFLVGLLGGTHCIGMCGGIVGALTVQMPGTRQRTWPLHLAYNAGRISSYGIAGAVMGSVGSLGLLLNNLLPVQMGLYVTANLMLLVLGLYLLGVTRPLAFAERLGLRLWGRIQPYTRRFLPARSVAQAFPLGMLWGWLPCGLVYSALATALASGSVGKGALVMLAFGLGTLPNLLLAGLLLVRFRRFAQARATRVVSGLLVLGYGLYGLLNLWRGQGAGG
jgi:sulfite exporter TauE/SafE